MLASKLSSTAFPRADGLAAGWAVSPGHDVGDPRFHGGQGLPIVDSAGRAGELVWLLEHPPLYTAGVSARAEELLDPDRFPVF